MSEKLARLIDVKSIVTLLLVIVLCILTLKQMPTGELFNNAVMLVLGFFFGKNIKSGTSDGTAVQAAAQQTEQK